MGVRVNFTSQSTTATLLIENGSLFEGESEFEKLKIYLITLVSIRSDWEDLPWLFRSVEYLNTWQSKVFPAQAQAQKQMSRLYLAHHGYKFWKVSSLSMLQKIQKNPSFNICGTMLHNPTSSEAVSLPLLLTVMGKVYTRDSTFFSHKARRSLSVSSTKNLFPQEKVISCSRTAKKMSLDASQEKGEESETEAAAPKGDKEQGEVTSSTVTSGVGISVHTEDQAGSDLRKAHEVLGKYCKQT
ncbi:hypothetical protein Tco_0092806 [Tanacetum coccineum]